MSALMQERLARHRLAGTPFPDIEAAVRSLCAVQAQEYPLARWSLGQRLPEGCREADIDRALSEGVLLRTHVLRDTWHLVLARDIRWLMALTGPRIQARNATMYRKLDLDDGLRARAADLLARSLAEGHRTRPELAAILAAEGLPAAGMHLAYLLMHAEVEGVICSGALRGKHQTYALLEARAPASAALSREEMLAALAARYFAGHGPATARDLGRWASLPLADVQQGIDLACANAALESREVGGRVYWSAPGAPPAATATAPQARLVQLFDEYVIGYADSRDLIEGPVAAGGPLVANQILLLDGRVAGQWRRTLRTRAVEVEVLPGRPLSAPEAEAIGEEAERYGRFVALPVRWRLGEIPAK